MAVVPLSGDSSIIIDIAVTSIVLSRLASLFDAPAAHREFRAGWLSGSDTVSGEAAYEDDRKIATHLVVIAGEATFEGVPYCLITQS